MGTRVSLLMTVHNREAYLAASIQSVLNQAYPHLELIIWDDGSTDSSPEIGQQAALRDRRVRWFGSSHHGRCQSLQRAHAQAVGEFVGWVDSDDLLSPFALSTLVPLLVKQPSLGFAYSNHMVMDSSGQVEGVGHRCSIPYSPQRLLVDFMTFHFRLIRRSLFDHCGGINPELPLAIDYDLCLRLSEVASVQHVPLPLYHYRRHAQSLSQQQRQLQTDCAQQAVRSALHRRGLSPQHQLIVTPTGRFHIQNILQVETPL